MNVDKALANFGKFFENLLEGGDTGKRRVEHRNFLQLRFTHLKEEGIGHIRTTGAPTDHENSRYGSVQFGLESHSEGLFQYSQNNRSNLQL